MAKLKDIDLPEKAKKSTSSAIQTLVISGDTVARYNEACDQIEKADLTIKELKPTLVEAGLSAIFAHNCANPTDPKARVSSINLIDDDPDAVETLRVTWQKKNLKNDPKQVVAEFDSLRTVDDKRANINDHAAYAVVADFDADVFSVNGKFDQQRYDDFVEALTVVSERYKVPMPLSCAKVLVPKADFHDRRWSVFDIETNLVIQAVLPTQVNLTPIRPEKVE